MQTPLMTYKDVVDGLLDYVGGVTDVTSERFARRAIQAAMSDVWSKRTWTYNYKRGRIYTSSPYGTGTVTYLATSGSFPRQMILSGGIWPTWAADGVIRIGQIPYFVFNRVSDTSVQLASNTAPPSDISAPSVYQICRESYPMPVDFGNAGDVVNLGFARVMMYQTPDEFVRQQRVNISPANPFMYTLMRDPRRYGTVSIYFYPSPDAIYNMDFSYSCQSRQLKIVEYSTGKASVTSASLTVTGSGTKWTSDMPGSVIRFAQNPTDKVPTGLGGASPFYLQRTISGFTGEGTMTLDQDPQQTLTNVPYSISDPVDIESGPMSTYFLREAEYQMRIVRRIEPTKNEQAEYQRALMSAFEADARHRESRAAFATGFSTIRIATFPRGGDIT